MFRPLTGIRRMDVDGVLCRSFANGRLERLSVIRTDRLITNCVASRSTAESHDLSNQLKHRKHRNQRRLNLGLNHELNHG